MKKIILYLLIFIFAISIINNVAGLSNNPAEKLSSQGVIIKLKQNKNIDSLNLDKTKIKKIIHSNKKYFTENGLDRLYALKVDDVPKAIMDLRKDSRVEYVEPNYIVTTTLIPNDPYFPNLYGLHNTGQTGGLPDADIDAPEAWDMQTGNGNVIVAVIDTGVYYNHSDLAANMWHNPNEIPNNGIDDDNNGFIDDYLGWDFYNKDNDPMDDHGHGTHVAGTIGAVGNNGVGVAGVNWNVKIMPLKFLGSTGSGTTADAILAIEYAILMHADIMSNSWGGGGFSQALRDAIQSANNAGILFVAAAGNSGANADIYPMYPAAYDNDNIVSVAATDSNDNLASFSNYGKTSVDLAAPGVNIFSTVPQGSCSLCDVSGYRYLSGTSMATPHVSGAAALIKSQYPSINYSTLKARLLGSVDHLTVLEGKTVSEGRLNIFNALQNDITPPGAITNLNAVNKAFNSVTLSWTATGDYGNVGTASNYDLRYSALPITEANWDFATKAANTPKPKVAGSAEVFKLTGLISSTTYYFAIKAIDDVGNIGIISNIANDTTTEPIAVFYDNFESGVNGWASLGLWHQETAQSYSPSTSWTYNTGAPNYNYDIVINNNSSRNSGNLTSPSIDLTTKNNAILRFYDYYQTETGTIFDVRWIQISINNGPFANLVQLYGEPMNIWHQHEIDISAFAGNTIQIRFFFDTIDSIANNFWGWSIDDFTVLTDNGTKINNPPVANAGADQKVTDIDGNGFESITLNGTKSYDADGFIVSYEWKEGTKIIGNAAIVALNFSLGNHTVDLTVKDNGGLFGSDQTIITVIDIVKITKAQYKKSNRELTVEATSSNPNAILTLAGYGIMTKTKGIWVFRKKFAADPGQTVTVASSSGGSATANVVRI